MCRSRSIPRESGWAPLRADAPGRVARRRGKFPILDTAEARARALEALRHDYYVACSIPGVDTRIRVLWKALQPWQGVPCPPTIEKIEMVAATLKDGNYSAAEPA